MNDTVHAVATSRLPWNKGTLIGQKSPLKLREIWTLCTQLRIAEKTRDLVLFNLAIDVSVVNSNVNAEKQRLANSYV